MNTAQSKTLYRSRSNRMFGGVCGGLGDYTNIDPTIFRLLFVFGVIFGFGSLLIVYLVMLVVIPEEPMVQPEPPAPKPEAAQEG
jgi:phage shock protein PspC (stress-responsive transcriptional regulator)